MKRELLYTLGFVILCGIVAALQTAPRPTYPECKPVAPYTQRGLYVHQCNNGDMYVGAIKNATP